MILVTGASGFVGSALLDVLAQGRRPLLLLGRRRVSTLGFEEEERRSVEVDLLAPERLKELGRGVQSVIHLAGVPPGVRPRPSDSELTAMEHVLELAVSARVDRFVYLSASGASDQSPIPWLREKGRAETRLRATGVPYVILRAGPLFGEQSAWLGALREVVEAEESIRLPLLCHGRLRLLSHVDAAIALAIALDHHVLLNQTVEIGGAAELSLEELLSELARRLGQRLRIRRGPFGGRSLRNALQERCNLTDPALFERWFAVSGGTRVAVYDRAIPMRRVSFMEDLRSYRSFGPAPVRPGEPLPVVEQGGAPLFVPAKHLRDEDEGEEYPDARALGRVNPFGERERDGEN